MKSGRDYITSPVSDDEWERIRNEYETKPFIRARILNSGYKVGVTGDKSDVNAYISIRSSDVDVVLLSDYHGHRQWF